MAIETHLDSMLTDAEASAAAADTVAADALRSRQQLPNTCLNTCSTSAGRHMAALQPLVALPMLRVQLQQGLVWKQPPAYSSCGRARIPCQHGTTWQPAAAWATCCTHLSVVYADAEASAADGGQQLPEQGHHLSSAPHGSLTAAEAAARLPAFAFSFTPMHAVASQSQRAIRHERLPPPLILPGSEVRTPQCSHYPLCTRERLIGAGRRSKGFCHRLLP